MRVVQESQYLHTFHLLPILSNEYFIGRKSLVNPCLPQQLLKPGCGLNCISTIVALASGHCDNRQHLWHVYANSTGRDLSHLTAQILPWWQLSQTLYLFLPVTCWLVYSKGCTGTLSPLLPQVWNLWRHCPANLLEQSGNFYAGAMLHATQYAAICSNVRQFVPKSTTDC